MTTSEAITKILVAGKASDLFGGDARSDYRDLAKLCHPDFADASVKHKAGEATRKLNRLYHSLSAVPDPFKPVLFGDWVATGEAFGGDIADLYWAESSTKGGGRCLIKIARSISDNDLMARERANLGKLHLDKTEENFKVYLPKLLGSFKASNRQANVIEECSGHIQLSGIVNRCGPLDFRHIVWMGNRIWSLLGYIHKIGIVHGAVVPDHLLYDPISHGLKLIDWCYSSDILKGEHTPAMVPGFLYCYPPEVKRKTVSAETDIYMAAMCLKKAALAPPKAFRSFFDLLLAGSQASRPDDAWQIADQWKSLATKEFGKPHYLKLEVPA